MKPSCAACAAGMFIYRGNVGYLDRSAFREGSADGRPAAGPNTDIDWISFVNLRSTSLRRATLRKSVANWKHEMSCVRLA